ncbi:hypothetical protein Q9Q94_08750 [Uliginosibacterium sp. 31-16]|uniref:hypothetical protein n=1 Tax=Uliginosibacterium sp. 31-16 TaxID=3068315 RepID=UPI00273D709D|nr:hypothetical protein [Uliginosibacterium sp. 31-16]MDP5239616.1 hypothetical protein [Uliginosibacterium sp. 31-16]
MSGNRRLLIMLPVLLGAGWLALFGDKTPSDAADVVAPVAAVVRPAESAPEAPVDNPAITGETDSSQVKRVRDRVGLADLENGPQVDLFAGQGGAAPPPPQAEAPPPPEIPVQPFVLIGRMLDHDQWLVFLERGGKTHVTRARDVVDGFRVDAVTGTEIRLTQLTDKSRFVIPVGGEKKEPGND